MPNQEDRDAIDGLFDRLEAVARKSEPRDADAEAVIQQRLRDYPPAPYYMAQTIIVQEHALRVAQERIEELESQASQRPSGGFLGGLFGGDEPQRAQRRPQQSGPWGDAPPASQQQRGQGGGFLAGAAQTALGVTGGLLLGSAIAGMLTGDAQAAEEAPPEEPVDDTDAGGDMGDDDFDLGGGF